MNGLVELIGITDLSAKIGFPVPTLRKWVLHREIPYYKVGRSVRFSVPEINAWLGSRRVGPLTEGVIRDRIA